MSGRIICGLLIVGVLAGYVPPASASSFDPGFIISDEEATETVSFTSEGVRQFLVERGSGLADLRVTDTDGVVRDSADIIMNAAVRNRVSPRLLLALLQREQSLLSDPRPRQSQLDWAAGWGVCDSCSTADPTLQKFRGFANQLEYAASGFRYFLDNGPTLGYLRQKNQAVTIDGVSVTPRTWATAHLYNYTPHLRAQENFWSVWQKYFVRRYPSGTLATAKGIPGTWFIKYGTRRKIKSVAVVSSLFDTSKIVTISANDLLAYPEDAEIKFPNYSLLRSPRGTVFLLVGEERRGIASQAVFRKLGFNPDEVVDASWEDINEYREGAPITVSSAYPFGALLKEPKKGGVYYVENGVKHPIVSPDILALYFKKRRVRTATSEELDSLTTGTAVPLRDGELVKTADSSVVYVISDGQRLPIFSGDVFTKQGWEWKNVVTVSSQALALHTEGTAVTSN